MGRPAGSTNKPKKEFIATGADPVLRDDEGLSPADIDCPPLSSEQITKALAEYIEAGIRVKVTSDHWFLEKDYFVQRRSGLPVKKKLVNSGSVLMPAKSVIYAAAMLYSRFQEVEAIMASKNNKRGSKYSEMGEITGKDGTPIEDAA